MIRSCSSGREVSKSLCAGLRTLNHHSLGVMKGVIPDDECFTLKVMAECEEAFLGAAPPSIVPGRIAHVGHLHL
jgi:hypothetical protein